MAAKPNVLAISSFVGFDTVGLRAIAPALAALSCEAIELPTVVLSNHPGHAHVAGERMPAHFIAKSAEALSTGGWLSQLSSVVTGYLPAAEHVRAAREALATAKCQSPGLLYVLDPILGDDPKGLYIDEAAALAVRDVLVELADVLTPNRFELEWLTGCRVSDVSEAVAAARTLPAPAVVVTSVPAPSDHLATVLVTRADMLVLSTPKRAGVPHGTGDLLAGLLTAHLAHGALLRDALSQSHATLERVIEISCGRERLDLSALTSCAKVP